jgi:hypothetical protein
MHCPLIINSETPNQVEDPATPQKGRARRRPSRRVLAIVSLAILCSWAVTMAVVEVWPALGAMAADQLRGLVGPRAVAQVESLVFQVQDTLQHWQYQVSGRQAAAPWGSAEILPASSLAIQDALPIPIPTGTPTPKSATRTSTPQDPVGQPQDPPLTSTADPTPTATPYVFQPPALIPFGTIAGEGAWQPYLYDREGQVVAVRTFLQPDPERPYTVVAVVAFDLTRTRLHFVLGFNEPSVPEGPKGDGLIPETDRQAGVLLAAFNGGFRTANGHFGAMADGVVALPPLDGYATVGIYRSGEVRIGNWGAELEDTPDLLAWRQNCRLIIQDGEVSPRVYSDSVTDWGASVSNQIITRRSGLGLDRRARTLYYFAGPSLSMPVLADTMLVAGVHNGMLLDINHFWVHFTAIQAQDGQLVAQPLLPDDMTDHIDRYLGPSPADFFYVTTLEGQGP